MRSKRFAVEAARSYPQVVDHDPSVPLPDWPALFGRVAPLHVELGMGAGHHLVATARREPGWNHVGVELKYFRVWQAARMATMAELPHLRYLIAKIEELEAAFGTAQVDRISLLFPDPWPRPRQARNRLTHPSYLERYRGWLRPGGELHFRTDNEGLYRYSRSSLREAGFELVEAVPVERVTTHYEARYLAEGKPIYGCVARAAEAPAR